MRVALITPHLTADDLLSRRVVQQERHFRTRGDEVVIYSATPPAVELTSELAVHVRVLAAGQAAELSAASGGAGDLYIFHCAQPYPLMENLRHLERGATVLYYYPDPVGGEGSALPTAGHVSTLGRLAACADLVVTESKVAAQTLVEQHGYTAVPVHLLPANDQMTPGEYAVLWAEVVAAVTAWLPAPPYPYGRLPALEELHPPNPDKKQAPATEPPFPGDAAIDSSQLAADLEALAAAAKTMQRDYVVRSRLPILGPILAWVRRNLTSHLREPYIDPTFQRQELFNRQVTQTLESMAESMARRQAATVAALEARIAELESRTGSQPDDPPVEAP